MLRIPVASLFPVLLALSGVPAIPGQAQSAEQAETISAKPSQSRLPLGIYDPDKRFKRKKKMSYEHLFVDWTDWHVIWLRKKVRYATRRGREILMTVEPWAEGASSSNGDTLFGDILNGDYDTHIASVCAEVALIEGRPLVRWGHEMEEVTGRYPWAREDSAGYIAAFRHFVTQCRAIAPKARFIWSPLGHKPLDNYYPGDGYVDLVGLPIYSYQKADRKWYGRDRTFKEAVAEKYNRVTHFEKPVILAELGVEGSRRYEKRWLKRLKTAGTKFPLLEVMLYFNMREKAAWPDGLGKPDWRVKPKHLR